MGEWQWTYLEREADFTSAKYKKKYIEKKKYCKKHQKKTKKSNHSIQIKISPEKPTKYLRQTLVFMWNNA